MNINYNLSNEIFFDYNFIDDITNQLDGGFDKSKKMEVPEITKDTQLSKVKLEQYNLLDLLPKTNEKSNSLKRQKKSRSKSQYQFKFNDKFRKKRKKSIIKN